MEELKQSIKNLDYKKAVGPDGIANAFLKHATDELLEILLKFLNLNIKHGMASSNWCHYFIAPIHKEGPKHTPGNYRGLCIMNSLHKLLCSLINERLTLYCNTHSLINKEQILSDFLLKNYRLSVSFIYNFFPLHFRQSGFNETTVHRICSISYDETIVVASTYAAVAQWLRASNIFRQMCNSTRVARVRVPLVLSVGI